MTSLCCSDTIRWRDRPNLLHDAKFQAFLDCYPNISQESSGYATAPRRRYEFIVQLVHNQGITDQGSVTKRFYGCQEVSKLTSQLPTLPNPPKTVKETSPSQVPPYRPPRIQTTTQAIPMKKSTSGYGSGWTQRSPVAPSSSTSWGSNGEGGTNSRRSNSGPPSWVSPDVADSQSNWRKPNNRASVSPTQPSKSPLSSRSPVNRSSGPGSGYFGPSRSPVLSRSASNKPPSSVASFSERDGSSAWETASNATETTWTNRFAMLDGNSSVNDDTLSETSDGLDSELVRRLADSVITQDDEEDFPSLAPNYTPPTQWTKTGPVILVELEEARVRKSGLVRSRHLKMFRCNTHKSSWTLYVYVASDEEDIV